MNKVTRLFLTALATVVISGCASSLPPEKEVPGLQSGIECDCDYRGTGGCKIVDPAIPNTACYCKYEGFWTCSGRIAVCEDPQSFACKNPSRDKASCEQGGGDCGGY